MTPIQQIQPSSGVPKKAVIREEVDEAQEQKDMFLKLMIAQLKNQDPSSPMDQKDMMAQLSQMSQLESQMNLTSSMESLSLSQGVGMIGKAVDYKFVLRNADGSVLRSEIRQGVVNHITQTNGVVKLVLKPEVEGGIGATIKTSDVTKIAGVETPAATGTP